MYLYPDNLKAKPMLWLWELRDVGIVGVGLLISVFAAANLGLYFPLVVTAVYNKNGMAAQCHPIFNYIGLYQIRNLKFKKFVGGSI